MLQATGKAVFEGDFNVDLLSDSTFSTDLVIKFQNNGYNPLITKETSVSLKGDNDYFWTSA